MKAKEVDNIIYEELGAFFKEQGRFKVLKKRSGFTCKSENKITFNLIFTYVNRIDYQRYKFSIGIYIEEIESILNKALGLENLKFSGYTEVLKLSYFLNNNFFTRNILWEVWDKDDIIPMLKQVKEIYSNHIVDFIDNNSSYEKILEILESIAEEETGVERFERILIISKLKNVRNFDEKVKKYRQILVSNNNIYLEEFDKVVKYLNENY